MPRLSPDNIQRAQELMSLYPDARSALIPVLHVLQEQDGYLSEEGMQHVAEIFGLTAAEVRGTASFYDLFHFEPVGRYLVAVCTNIACMLQGAYRLLEHIEERLGIAPGGTTPDGMFSLEDAECLALCGNAPCVTVNWRFFGDVDPEGFDRLVEDLRAGRLDDEVPPHGTLSRVRRSVGLTAGVDAAWDGSAPARPKDRAALEDGTVAERPPAASPPQAVDLSTRRSTPATASLEAAHLGES
ncbi:MAG TPA: NAD(P)H-dependent oxidoreductase subunit E [Acidimicrobiales bacterium]|nr:NAD(P)H-dependent oxidoreductase subunit E [Acidimicrobiales bacterium]